jgi:alpha-1,6-mannosyltransferase
MAIEQQAGPDEAAAGSVGNHDRSGTERLRSRLGTTIARLTMADDDVLEAGPTADPVPAAITEPASELSTGAKALVAGSLLAGVLGGLVVAGSAPVWHLAPNGWRFTLPGILPGVGASSLYFGALFLFGVLLLAAGWLGLLTFTSRRMGPPRWRLPIVIGAAVLWSLPFLAALPQLSTDVYAYGAQGYAANKGFDPSAVGVNVLPRDSCSSGFDITCYWSSTDSIWRNDPAPYGPVGVAVAEFAVVATAYNTYWTVFAFRAFAILGVVLAGIAVFQIARRRGVDEPMALAIAIANPVVVLHLVGGAHNDALMMGLLLLGLASWEKGRKLLAVLLITLAMCVKLPAVIGLGYLAWNWWGERRSVDGRERAKGIAIVGGLAAGIIGVLCLVVGIRLGWVTALTSTSKVTSTFSFFTKSGYVTGGLLKGAGVVGDAGVVVNVFRYVGLALALVIMVNVLRRSSALGVTKSTGVALLALMLLAPVVWPWYLPVAFAILAAVGVRRYRPTLIVLIIASSLVVWPSSVQSIEAFVDYEHWLGLGVVLLIAGCCVGAQYLARASERRGQRGLRVPTIEAVLITPSTAAPVADAVPATAGADSPAG